VRFRATSRKKLYNCLKHGCNILTGVPESAVAVRLLRFLPRIPAVVASIRRTVVQRNPARYCHHVGVRDQTDTAFVRDLELP